MLLARVGGRRARAAISFWKKGGKQVCSFDRHADIKQKSCLSQSSHLCNPVVLRNPNLSNIQNNAIRIFPKKKRFMGCFLHVLRMSSRQWLWCQWSGAPFDPSNIREGKSPDDKKNSAFSTKFFANFHYFCVLFPSSRRNSTKPQHSSMCHYIAKNSVESSSIFYGNLMLCINWFY
jgi:hypothetical protein